MKARFGFLLTSAAVGALSIGLGSIAMAADADVQPAAPVFMKAPAYVPDVWWFHGYFETGGRDFVNDPCYNCSITSGKGSLAKYYEYSSIKPGAFADGHVATGSANGLYQIDGWANNVGYSDQRYLVDFSKAGEQYLTFGWDQTPHVYSTSALTLYNGVGTSALTLPPGLANQLFLASGGFGSGNPITPANAAKVQAIINANVKPTDIGIQRDTAAFEYRYTPTPDWDIRADFSDMHRTGTQVTGVVFSPSTSGVRVDAPQPIDDTTRNFGVSGEYAGTSPWNQKFNVKIGYAGSTYTDAINGFTIANPFCPTGAGTDACSYGAAGSAKTSSSPTALMSTDPSNQTNMVTATLGADLPLKSRYMGTLSYSVGTQNQAFLPFTLTPGLPPINGAPSNSLASLPASSLNGQINTTLSNNVLTTQFTPELSSKASYRYYDYDNKTPEIRFSNWILDDTVLASARSATYAPVQTLSISYTKQNAAEELNWRPTKTLNLGIGYGYERYDWTRADVDVTNENSIKGYADWRPTSWITARSSLFYSERRFDNYNYLALVGLAQWPSATQPANGQYASNWQQFNVDNRNRTKGQIAVSVDVIHGLTVTPVFNFKNDDYNLAGATALTPGQGGLTSDHSYTTGVEANYLLNRDTNFLFSYMYEPHKQSINYFASATASTSDYVAQVNDKTHTFVIGLDQVVIPNKLDFKASYTYTHSTDSQPANFLNAAGQLTGLGPSAATGGQFPDVKTDFQRVEAQAKYKFDDALVQQNGFKGQAFIKLKYAWERNAVTNWQIDSMQDYMYSPTLTTVGYMTWMAYDNPNYNVQMVSASFVLKW